MNTNITHYSNGYFCVREDRRNNILTVTLINAVIPAAAWNKLRDNICNDTKITNDTTVYFDYLIINGETDRFSFVTVENWRRLGFSGNNIKNCIPSPPSYIIDEANKFFYYNNNVLKQGVLCGKKLERVQQMILKEHYIDEFKALAKDIRANFKMYGMTDEEIDAWFQKIIHDVYHPKC